MTPPVGSEAIVEATQSGRQGLLTDSTLSAVRRTLVLLGLAPLTILLATRLPRFIDDPVFGVYAVLGISVTITVMFLGFARYRDPSVDEALDSDAPPVTCLVAVKNEVDGIEVCVRSLVGSTYPRLEVIVVDDGSDDGTTELLVRLRDELGFHLLSLAESIGKKRALTEGASRAQGEILVFTDSDCVLKNDAIDCVVRAFQADSELGAVSGHTRALNADERVLTKMQDTWYDGQFAVWKAAESVYGAVTCISGPLAAFRREAIYNFFPAWANDRFLGREFRFATDRQLTAYVLGSFRVGPALIAQHADSPFVREQTYPCRRWRVGYVKSAKAWTNVPTTLPKLIRQQVRWKKSFIRNLFFTGGFYWRRGLVPSFMFYSHCLFVLMTPIMFARHLVYMPLTGNYSLALLYLVGVFLKGGAWAVAYRINNPGCSRWVYRPLMSLLAALMFSPIILYSMATIRKSVWARG